MRNFIGAIFLFMGILSLFTDESFWYTLVDFAIGYILVIDNKKE